MNTGPSFGLKHIRRGKTGYFLFFLIGVSGVWQAGHAEEKPQHNITRNIMPFIYFVPVAVLFSVCAGNVTKGINIVAKNVE